MKKVTILLLLLLIGVSSNLQASDFRISVGYRNYDHDGCDIQGHYCGHKQAKKVVYVGQNNYYSPWLRNFVHYKAYRRFYSPQKGYCQVFWDKTGRKIRKCYLYSQKFRDNSLNKHSCSHAYGYGQGHKYCRYK
jgi:hypothetical protein